MSRDYDQLQRRAVELVCPCGHRGFYTHPPASGLCWDCDPPRPVLIREPPRVDVSGHAIDGP